MKVLCATQDYSCHYCDANGFCMMSADPTHIYFECDDFAAEVGDLDNIDDLLIL